MRFGRLPLERGQIYRVKFPPRKFGDSVIEGLHYAVVVQSDGLNRIEAYGNVVIVPFTSQVKGRPSHYAIAPNPDNGFERVSYPMCEQVLTISRDFLGDDLTGKVTDYDSNQIAARAAVFALGIPVKPLLTAGLLQA